MRDSPYPGLRPFAEEDAAFFFGRESETRIVSANLRTRRLTVLYGPSGVGKSSMLQAGVIPHFHQLNTRLQLDHDSPDDALEKARRSNESIVLVTFESWREDPQPLLKEAILTALKEVL